MASYNLATSLSYHRLSGAQLGNSALLINGHDPNLLFDLRAGTTKTLGMVAPGAPTAAAGSAGNVLGTVSYRCRWSDASTHTVSQGGTALAVLSVSTAQTITKPASTAPSRATHWVIERTTNGGRDYFPINITAANPDGTLLATTTFSDNDSDNTIRNRQRYTNLQGQPPVLYRITWANGTYVFMAGGRVHRPSANYAVTNGATSLTSSTGQFTSDMVGQDFTNDLDTDGVTYRIATFTNSNTLVLASNYAGTSNTTSGSIAGQRDLVAFCESAELESWGSALPNGYLSNLVRVGADGEPITAGVGLGAPGCLICKDQSMFYYSYRVYPGGPGSGGDGRIVPLQSRRGAFAHKAIKMVDGRVYGMDTYGIWRLDPGGEPVEIGRPLAYDWRNLSFLQSDNFFIGYDALFQCVLFYVGQVGLTYPRLGYVWDLSREKWIDTKIYKHRGVSCAYSSPDLNGAQRNVVITEVDGAANAYGWMDNIGQSMGVPPLSTPLTGTLTAGSSTTLTIASAAFDTTGQALKGIEVELTRASDGSQETQIITSNSATVLTTTAFLGTAPAVGDTIVIGPIRTRIVTPRMNAGDATRKKTWKRAYIWMTDDSSAVGVKVRVYYDGSTTAFSERVTLSEDGVAQTVDTAPVTITSSSLKKRYYVPLGNQKKVDINLEIYSSASGKAWQILGIDIEYEIDTAPDPRKT